MSMLTSIARASARRLGVELQRYPQASPDWRKANLLHAEGINVVLDIGANVGQYGQGLRDSGYLGAIHSFEPLSDVFFRLEKQAAGDISWSTHQNAVGDRDGEITLHVAANGGASSSALPMLATHRDAAPEALYVGTEDVRLRRLDSVIPELDLPENARVLLKADVQGLEGAVLDGAVEFLASKQFAGLELELCLKPLYEDGMTWREGIDRADALKLTPALCEQVFFDNTGHLLAMDMLFFR